MDKFTKKLIKVFIVYLFVLAAFVILFKTVWMLNVIPSGSMEPTIMAGDVVLGTRYDVGEGEIERYDILVFAPPDEPDVTYIKRVIGLPGETIVVENGRVYADGVELDDDFVKSPMNRKGDGTYVVPKGCYFFLGDNRNQSKDSRFWNNKYVPLESIEGKARFIIFPFKNFGKTL
ncbi:MAG: signal peptidase I [Lachnospiraceae bacterium]|nr:signal peptidase I [Lachnospiraceae bacterium]